MSADCLLRENTFSYFFTEGYPRPLAADFARSGRALRADIPNNQDIFIDSVTKGKNSIDCDYFPPKKIGSFSSNGKMKLP